MEQGIGVFVIMCVLMTITPGADTALILNVAIKSGKKSVLFATLGICTGLLFHATMSSLGLSVILRNSVQLYTGIKLLGAAYLAYLGIKSLCRSIPQINETIKESRDRLSSPRLSSRDFGNGALTNILNPKVAVFYLTFLPQFVSSSENILIKYFLLSSIHILLSFGWLYLIGRFVEYFSSSLPRPSVKRSLEATTGIALLAFGIHLALSG